MQRHPSARPASRDAALTALGPNKAGLNFTRLKGLTGATDGNLGAHFDHVARACYVEVTKAFVGRRPRATVKASPDGRAAFARLPRGTRASSRGQ